MQISSAKCGAWMRLILECDLTMYTLLCNAKSARSILGGSYHQECGFSSQDVTITFVLLNLLLSAQLIFSFMT